MLIGQPTPTDPASFTFVALDPARAAADNVRHRAARSFAKRIGGVSRANTRTPYTLEFAGADGGPPLTRRGGRSVFDRLPGGKRVRRVKGKSANYLLRWANPTGEKGPRSETATATIGA